MSSTPWSLFLLSVSPSPSPSPSSSPFQGVNLFNMSEGAWEKFSQVAMKGAEHDSREYQPHPKCLEGTQVVLLNHIYGLSDTKEKN
ncbi:uncharacterized protein BJ212DRAFT_1575841 [Suillus subaureus]|uniref:Uncharacterized protein n=1 Tax=Suillus subaureus TaxID=48587 RepID=A0A9P7EF79_9AGAM|nr:uncharacterized protein BJ212DRAFT_1575841 [Suillus subaureus]KAG1819553.1 hypothetical protein BJ212DRAFT_1575841 [Suillus subaureus]